MTGGWRRAWCLLSVFHIQEKHVSVEVADNRQKASLFAVKEVTRQQRADRTPSMLPCEQHSRGCGQCQLRAILRGTFFRQIQVVTFSKEGPPGSRGSHAQTARNAHFCDFAPSICRQIAEQIFRYDQKGESVNRNAVIALGVDRYLVSCRTSTVRECEKEKGKEATGWDKSTTVW